MKLKANFPLALLLVLICILHVVASVSVASTSRETNRDPERDLRQCEQRCQRQQPYFEEHRCRERCEREQRERGTSRRNEAAAITVGSAEEEYERCQQRCRGTGQGQWQCQRTCQDQYEAPLEREREREKRHQHHGGRGERYPREHGYRECARKCEQREEGFPRQRQCKLRCEEEFGRGERHRCHERWNMSDENHHKTTKAKEENENPYYFDSESFDLRYSTQEGRMRVLKRFSEKSDLLLGINNFRVGLYEANPNTFMLPHHWDADSVLFLLRGTATITFLKQENRETFDLEHGDLLMIPAGATAYLVNSHNNETLQIAELLHPVNTPGHFEQFFGVGGEDPESFFNSFSTEILQAALDVPREQVERLFKQQKEGAIVKARREQVKALTRHRMSGRTTGRESTGPINLLTDGPKFSNDHGEFYEVSPNNYWMLEDLDVSVAYCDIKQGSMMAPHFNSRTTYIVMVEEGSGYIEMACPHLESESQTRQKKQGQQRGSVSYKKVRSRLSKGNTFVIPAGHPIAMVASENENLKAVGFGINALNNQMNFLAGQENIISQLDREAKELSFNMPAAEVAEVFQTQRRSHFMPGPQKRKSALVSILDFAGF